jgi:hypothetical protein
MNKLYIIIGIVVVALLASCGKQYKAETLVEEFIEQNAIAPEKMVSRNFAKLDSTKVIRDSLVEAMQQRGGILFKKDIAYPAASANRMLYFLRMKFVYEGDTLQQTFYIDESLQQVVSFK